MIGGIGCDCLWEIDPLPPSDRYPRLTMVIWDASAGEQKPTKYVCERCGRKGTEGFRSNPFTGVLCDDCMRTHERQEMEKLIAQRTSQQGAA